MMHSNILFIHIAVYWTEY